ncbi:MAG: 37S ribosomal protein S22 [Bathelium mastoideum]|nr:MAG: 37S ribosomal protein S22 [Bathelium mastoideum]
MLGLRLGRFYTETTPGDDHKWLLPRLHSTHGARLKHGDTEGSDESKDTEYLPAADNGGNSAPDHAVPPPSQADVENEIEVLPRSQAELEHIVRRARQKHGDALPEDTLDKDEYRVYERLYGPPLRIIEAEDVDAALDPEEEYIGEEESSDVLLREGIDGQLEEVEYEPDLDPEQTEAAQILSRIDEQISSEDFQYLDKRERKRLKKLQRQAQKASSTAQDQQPSDPDNDDNAASTYSPLRATASPADDDHLLDPDAADLDDAPSGEALRAHPLTLAGRFRTHPSTLSLPPSTLLNPLTSLLSAIPAKHVRESAVRVFGGADLPYSPLKPATFKQLPQRPIALSAAQPAMAEREADAFLAAVMPPVYASVVAALVEVHRRVGKGWLEGLVRKEGGPRVLDAGGGGVGVVAVREMLRAEWERLREDGADGDGLPASPPLGKAVVLTGSAALRHRASAMLENTTFVPRLPDYVHVSSDAAGSTKPFDIVVAPHTLWPLLDDYRRKLHVQNYWSLLNPNGGVLVLLEKGNPRGFEIVAGARKMLLHNHIASPGAESYEAELQAPTASRHIKKERGMIIAPCTNHGGCPLYKTEGVSKGRKDFCHFPQRFVRPPFLQHILGAKSSNHDDVHFSYLAVQRGVDRRHESSPFAPSDSNLDDNIDKSTNDGSTDTADTSALNSGAIIQNAATTDAAFSGYTDAIAADPDASSPVPHSTPPSSSSAPPSASPTTISPLNLPRLLLPPLKRKGHVIMDVCTPAATLERWTVPRSWGAQAYRDARKSQWGDLWALGGKTRRARNVKMGEGRE